MNQNIYDLFATPNEKRDEAWETKVLNQISFSRFKLKSNSAMLGPDGWPYMFLEAHPEGDKSFAEIFSWTLDKGIGLAINPTKSMPDFILNFGMLVNYQLRGEFLTQASSQNGSARFEFDPGTPVHAGQPSSDYLPDNVRSVLRKFLNDNGVSRPQILVMSINRNSYDLCFSLESLGNPPESEHIGILEALSWFLPLHYNLTILSQKGLPPFYDL